MTEATDTEHIFFKGERVRWSAHGKDTFPRRLTDRIGTVPCWPHGQWVIPVCWDGSKTPQYLARIYLEPVVEAAHGEEQNNEPR